jgi:signal transduction histidine kinase/CheY-like chemotaxis protein
MTLRRRILLFAVFLLLPAIAGGAFLVAATYGRERAALENTLRDTTRAMSLVVDREFERRAAILRLLAASASLQRWDLENLDREARAAVLGLGGQVAIYDRDTQFINTMLPPGAKLPLARNLPVQFAEKNIELSDLFTGTVTRRRLMAMNAGVRVRGKLYNVSISILPGELQQIIDEQRLPAGWTAAIVNRQGRIIARHPSPERWIGSSATPDLLRELRRAPDGLFDSVTLDGVRSAAFFSTATRYGATFVIGVPRTELEASLYRSMTDVAIGALILLLIGLAVSLWATARMLRPVDALRAAAEDLEEGRVATFTRTGIVEYDVVGDALTRASEHIRASNLALEQRVAQAVADVEATQARLAQSQKLEAVGRLTGGIAHDFNNLLQTLSTGLHVLDRMVQEQRARPLIAAGLRAVDRAAQLVQQMLSFTRRQPLRRQVVDFRNQLLSMEPLLSRALPAHMTLSTRISPDLWAIETDPAQLEVALLNLIFNARDAVGKEGTIEIRARNEPGAAADDRVVIEVTDNGSGIAADIREKVFEPFFTTKPVGQGTGLGLSQVHGFATESGGSVSLHSETGKGTTVAIRLPRALRLAAAEEAAPGVIRLQRSCRLLFVEDDALVTEVVSSALHGAGFEIVRSRTADEALALIRGGQSFDAVFSDIVMPGSLSGIDLAEILAREHPQLPIVLASGYSERAPAQQSISTLSKPYSIETLVRTLIEALGSRGRA